VLLECLTGQREYAGSTVEVALARLQRAPRVPDSLPAGWPGLLRAMTAREPADRPSPAEAASELSAIATGGEATTVLAGRQPVAAPPPLSPQRTQVLSQTAAVPRPTVAPRPVAPPPPRTNWPVVLLMLLLVAVIAAGAVYLLTQQRQQGPAEPLPAIELDLPEQLRNDLTELQREVES
jgi:hypothetical protein